MLENTGFGFNKSKNITPVHVVWCKTATTSEEKCHKHAAHTAAGRWSLGMNAEDSSGASFSTNPSVASKKTYFTEMANRNRMIPRSLRLSWWLKIYRLRRHNIQTSFWLIPPQKNKFALPLPWQRTNWSKNLRADKDLEPTQTDIAFSVAASGNTTVTYA